jgi:uncharacterized protein
MLSRACQWGEVGACGVKMFISVQELELHRIDFDEEFQPEIFDLGADVRPLKPIGSQGRAELIEEHHGKHQKLQDIRLVGDLSVSLELNCARCLEPVVRDITKSFDLLYRPLGSDAGREEVTVTQAEAEIGYYQGDGLLLEDVLREQVLLSVPLKVVCSEECKGLCPRCGRNLNNEGCDCAEPVPDPRWQALKDIKKSLEQ